MILSAWKAVHKACGNVGGCCNVRGRQGKDALACVADEARMRNNTSTHRPSPYEKIM